MGALAPTKAGLIARCDKRECPIVSQKCHQGIFVKRPCEIASDNQSFAVSVIVSS